MVRSSMILESLALSMFIVMATCQFREDQENGHVEQMFLFPDKKPWCEVQPIRQEVSWPGCLPKLVRNGVCFGQCFSYSIPQPTEDDPDPSLQHCESCKPLVTRQVQVVLRCPFREVREMIRLIEIVDECGCQQCDQIINDKRHAEDSASYSSSSYSSDYVTD